MSVNLIPNVLNKLHRDKESVRTTAGGTGKSDECSTSAVPQVSPLRTEWLSTLVTDECESLTQLALHIHSLLVSSASDLRAISSLILITKFWAYFQQFLTRVKWTHICCSWELLFFLVVRKGLVILMYAQISYSMVINEYDGDFVFHAKL